MSEEEDVNGIKSTEAEIDEEHKFSKSDNTKISIGALEENKKTRGPTLEDRTAGRDHPLFEVIINILRAWIGGLHHYLMLFVMLAFSVLFGSIEAPGLGIGARYMFTMAIGTFLRAISFASTILPSPRPWCAASRFDVQR